MTQQVFPRPNSFGVYSTAQCESIRFEIKRFRAVVWLVQSGRNSWVWGYDLQYSAGGACSGPSRSRKACSCRSQALVDGVALVVKACAELVHTKNSCVGSADRRNAKKAVEGLLGMVAAGERAAIVKRLLEERGRG